MASEEDTDVKQLAMLFQLLDGQNDMRARLTALERERPHATQHARVSLPAPQPGVSFADPEDDEVSESELAALRSQVLEGLNSTQRPLPAQRRELARRLHSK